MKHVKDLISSVSGKVNTQHKPSDRDALMREVFQKLYDSYGDAFAPMRRINGEPSDKRAARVRRSFDTWAGALSTLTDHQVRIGVTRCIREVPFGSKITPADITTRAHAEPQHLGFASVDDAFIECVKNANINEGDRVWSSGLVANAFTECTSWVWKRLSEKEQQAKFRQHYMYLLNVLIRSGDNDMAVPRALPAPEYSEADYHHHLVHALGEDRANEVIELSNQCTGMDDVLAIVRGTRHQDSETKEACS